MQNNIPTKIKIPNNNDGDQCVKKCPYSELFWSAFFSHFPAFGLNLDRYSVFSLNAGKCGKNVDQNNSEYGYFLRSG